MNPSDSPKPHPGTETYRRRAWKGLYAAINVNRIDLEDKLRKQQRETAKGLSECNSLEELYKHIQTLPEDVQDAFLITVCTGF